MAQADLVPQSPPSGTPTPARSHQFHLYAAFVTLLAVILALIAFNLYADALAAQYVHAVAPLGLPQTDAGLAWQRAALNAGDLLPIFGSSELDHRQYEGSYNGTTFFKTYPTGFTILPVGSIGNTCLVMLQNIGALGSALRGKKVVISLSPPWFTRPDAAEIRRDQYVGNYSRLHAYGLVFNSDLSWDLKHQAAFAMLRYPSTYHKDTVLRFALDQLAANTPISRILYALVVPFGKLNEFVLTEQDKLETVRAVWAHPHWQTTVPHQPAVPDWNSTFLFATQNAQTIADTNSYGIYNSLWKSRAKYLLSAKLKRTDAEFLQTVHSAPDWTDCALLLSALHQLGARALVLSQPLAGAYYSQMGVTFAARQAYYSAQRTLVESNNLPFIDFADHDSDRLFVVDPYSHLSAKGWAYYDQALDAFYHNPLGPQ